MLRVKKRAIHAFAWLLAASTLTLAGDNWPNWRGPDRNGVSDETNLPLEWSTTGNIHWKLDLPGRSGSTPVVWGDRIFVISTRDDQILLWSVDRPSGTIQWERSLGGGNRRVRKANMSTPSPGHRRRERLGSDQHRSAAPLRHERQPEVDARYRSGLLGVGSELGLRILASAARRLDLRAGAPRYAHRRPPPT